jgi:hypothetical protein
MTKGEGKESVLIPIDGALVPLDQIELLSLRDGMLGPFMDLNDPGEALWKSENPVLRLVVKGRRGVSFLEGEDTRSWLTAWLADRTNFDPQSFLLQIKLVHFHRSEELPANQPGVGPELEPRGDGGE